MISPTTMVDAFGRNVEIIKMQTSGLSQEDSLRQACGKNDEII